MAARGPLAVAFDGFLMSPHALSTAELRAWLRLADAPGLPPATLRVLLDAFGSPGALLDAPDDAIAAASSPAAAQAVRGSARGDLDARADAARTWLDGPGNAIVTLGDPAYPPRLLDLHDPPPLLYVKGRVALLHARAIAIVGSRHATPQGLADATHFARTLSDAGFAIASGLALGIDAAAHRGGLDGRSGTIAVIGTGADLVYPARHRPLAHEIAAHGAIVSEWPLGTPARAAHFPQRNRLIAALASGVLVVEAAPRSGSLITARLANEMGRDVFAMPGSIHAPLAQGCHALIRDGAKLTAAPDDVLEEYGPVDRPAATPGDTGPAVRARALVDPHGPEHAVLAALGYSPVTYEWLAERSGLPDDALHQALLALELAGRVAGLPGGRFVRLDAPASPQPPPGMLQSPA
ncbi:DNA-processing protein DprA [Burkholderia stagnalis]|uniref:DNA-processing protein DprA n=1 Tax=Burkholderia stagnalis TaxID=1503054 RepID=UPI000F57755A|nr:DNA-processing protein DprA [Burkholderia stagnalis]RQQ46128.1 DNA-protecting protein DprA [Burkholderia stagnalis]RQY03273.1 DNA-protecting protein DprA [Burkholderia stagnalis]RQY15178.1 DNA-protecting protein DprA [Burkholderia stagnalis]RQY34893.1 DNA-protecting protein DprA [Burkholderia stagnalis]